MQSNQNRTSPRYLLLLAALAGIIVTALILFACAGSQNGGSDSIEQQSDADENAEQTLSTALSDYTIVRGDSSGNPVLKQALNLRADIRAKAGTDLPLVTDFTPDEGNPEILVGMTNRRQSIDVSMELTESTKFIVRTVDNKIVILANTQKGLAEAVTYLSNEYLSGAAKATDVSEINHTEPLDDVILMNKNRRFQFVLPNGTDEAFSQCVNAILETYEFSDTMVVSQSDFQADHAVYVGNAPEDSVSASYADIIDQNEYIARLAAGNVYLQGDSDLLTLMALGEFLETLCGCTDYDFEGNLCIALPTTFNFSKTWEHSVPRLTTGNLDNSESVSANTHIFYYSDVSKESVTLFKQQLAFLGFKADPVIGNYYQAADVRATISYLPSNKTLSVTVTSGSNSPVTP